MMAATATITAPIIARDWAAAQSLVVSAHRDAAAAAKERRRRKPLTAREWDVVHQVLLGRSHKETADQLGITDATLKVHMSSIIAKTGTSDRLTVALWALRELGLLREEQG